MGGKIVAVRLWLPLLFPVADFHFLFLLLFISGLIWPVRDQLLLYSRNKTVVVMGRNSSAGIHPPEFIRQWANAGIYFNVWPFNLWRVSVVSSWNCHKNIADVLLPLFPSGFQSQEWILPPYFRPTSALLPPYFRPSFFLVLADPSLADSFWDPLPSRAILYETLLRILNRIHRHPSRDSLGFLQDPKLDPSLSIQGFLGILFRSSIGSCAIHPGIFGDSHQSVDSAVGILRDSLSYGLGSSWFRISAILDGFGGYFQDFFKDLRNFLRVFYVLLRSFQDS